MMYNYYCFPGIIFETVGLKNETIMKLTEKEKANKIIDIILKICDVTIIKIKSNSRLKEIRQPRQLIHYFLRKNTELSLWSIANLTDNDHSTVMHSIKTVENDLNFDKELILLNDKINEQMRIELLTI